MRHKRRFLAGLLAGLVFASLPALADVKPPFYSMSVSLSGKASQKLKSSGETIHIAAMYFGTAKPGVQGDEVGQIQLGREETDLAKPGSVRLGKIWLKRADLKKIIEREPQLLINVYTSRKVFEDNLLDCGIFQGGVSVAAGKPIRIACKLIGE